MTWRLEVTHQTNFEYDSEVLASFNEARMTPMTTQSQTLIDHRLSTNPSSENYSFVDYFGTVVNAFDIQHPHTSLEITSTSTVETGIPAPQESFISWIGLASPALIDKYSEFLSFTDLVDPIDATMNLQALPSPIAAVHFLNDFLRKEIKYLPDTTNVKTSASQAWEIKSGVCQDFTHIALSFLKGAGIPARYVSGYLYHGEGIIGEVVTGESHSWCEAWVGSWIAFDPTNGAQVLEDHILVASGRDYHDVSPLRGIFSGGRSREVDVKVSLKRLA